MKQFLLKFYRIFGLPWFSRKDFKNWRLNQISLYNLETLAWDHEDGANPLVTKKDDSDLEDKS